MTNALLDIIFVLGLVAVAFGVGLVYAPAGVMVGGVLAAVAAVMVGRGRVRGGVE